MCLLSFKETIKQTKQFQHKKFLKKRGKQNSFSGNRKDVVQ